jgi:hypothetical protein
MEFIVVPSRLPSVLKLFILSFHSFFHFVPTQRSEPISITTAKPYFKMTFSNRAFFLFAALLVLCSFYIQSGEGISCPEDIPNALQPPSTQRHLASKRTGKGSQVYTCAVTPNGNQWTLVTPLANLYHREKLRGTHFIGPTWQDCDGSFVVAAKNASVDAPNPSEDIPWLLLKATNNSKDTGVFDDITWLIRSETKGGVAPPVGECTPDKLGSVVSVPYSAKYYFFSKGSSNC